jgi:hypothetical protein
VRSSRFDLHFGVHDILRRSLQVRRLWMGMRVPALRHLDEVTISPQSKERSSALGVIIALETPILKRSSHGTSTTLAWRS